MEERLNKKSAMNNPSQNNTLIVPNVSFGARAVIRPLPSHSQTVSSIGTIQDLRQKVDLSRKAIGDSQIRSSGKKVK